jgi:hypothetical protein
MHFPSQPAQVQVTVQDVVAAQGAIEPYKSDKSVKEEEMELRA